ncbi:MAG: hypothetical protein AAF587_26970 [Bacteroidota bacterium]
MKTNATFLPLVGHDQYVLFSLDEVGHPSAPTLTQQTALNPGLLSGCEFYTVRWIDRGSRQVFYLIFHMSNNYNSIVEQLRLVRLVADPASITITVAHRPPDNNARPIIVANALGVAVARIQHIHNGDPIVQLRNLR